MKNAQHNKRDCDAIENVPSSDCNKYRRCPNIDRFDKKDKVHFAGTSSLYRHDNQRGETEDYAHLSISIYAER